MAAVCGFVLAFCLLLGGLAVRFARPRAQTPAERHRLALLFGVLALFLGINSAVSYLGRRALVAVVQTKPSSDTQRLRGLNEGQDVIVVGRLSPDAHSSSGPGVRIDCDRTCVHRGPKPLPVTLEGETVRVVNEDYETRDWPIERHLHDAYSTYLEPGSPVVIIGTFAGVEKVSIRGVPSPIGLEPVELNAKIVFAGEYADFVAQAKRKQLVPTVLFALSALAAVAALGLALAGGMSRPTA